MKHPSEWRYTDEAFKEVKARVGGSDWNENHKDNEVFIDHGRGALENMGWFHIAYLHQDHDCRLYWEERRAQIVHTETKEVVAELRKIDSPRQLVEWCMMVREMVDG